MTAHELAKALLDMPDLPVVSVGDYGLYPVDEIYPITPSPGGDCPKGGAIQLQSKSF